jgi:hypothetical protein
VTESRDLIEQHGCTNVHLQIQGLNKTHHVSVTQYFLLEAAMQSPRFSTIRNTVLRFDGFKFQVTQSKSKSEQSHCRIHRHAMLVSLSSCHLIALMALWMVARFRVQIHKYIHEHSTIVDDDSSHIVPTAATIQTITPWRSLR